MLVKDHILCDSPHMSLEGLKALAPELLHHRIDVRSGTLVGGDAVDRHLSDLRGCFVDEAAYEAALQRGDQLVYSVTTGVEDTSDGALSYGLGVLRPGRIGQEYFLTRGHYHAWREAAEVYLGVSGTGGLVLENEGAERFVPLGAGEIVYVPGCTAHRTVNTGDEPFSYLGIYSAKAGHDYAGIADDNFRLVVTAGPDGPVAMNRSEFLNSFATSTARKAHA